MRPTIADKIQNLLSEKGECLSVSQIAYELDENPNSIRVTLRRLYENGLIDCENHLYCAKQVTRKRWLEKLAYGRTETQTKYHSICYTLNIKNSYQIAENWETKITNNTHYKQKIFVTQPKITIRIFQNDTVTIYIQATEKPLTTKELAQTDNTIDSILQAKFNAPLNNYKVKTIEASTDIINATLEPSTIEIRREDRLFRIYQKTLNNRSHVRIETGYYEDPINITKQDIKPFIAS